MHAKDKMKHLPFPYLCCRGYLRTDYLRFYLKMLLCLVPHTKYDETSSLQNAYAVHFLLIVLRLLLMMLLFVDF